MEMPSEGSSSIDTETFAAFSDALQAAALTTTRLAATTLPADLSFHRSVDPALAHNVDAFSDRILALASKLVHLASGKTSGLREEEDITDDFVRSIVDPMEGMLESTDSALDVFLGRRKDPVIPDPAVPIDPHKSKPKQQTFRGRLDPTLTHASHIPKPQLSFKYLLSNTDESPYIPATIVPHKWSAKVPLGYVFREEEPNKGIEYACEDEDEEESKKRTLHPYYYELTHPSYPDHVFNPPAQPSFPTSLDASLPGASSSCSPLTFVSTPETFLSMANTILSASELAIDLEHHSYRSYKGFLALMQISTRQGDFVVDLLVPEVREGLRQARNKNVEDSEEARMANEAGAMIAKIFADPSVIKVLHGAESDIVWLQQDFNIFVVGLFDTFHASRVLEFPKHSLAHLLETLCEFIPDKRYQLADWRIRPIPIEMLTYARSDTHFLLYIYDKLRILLIERLAATSAASDETQSLTDAKHTQPGLDLIYAVLTRSSRTALRLHENEAYDAASGTGTGGWDTLARKWNKIGLVGSPSQVRATGGQVVQGAVYKAVHRWREDMARAEDESTRYVLPTHHLFVLAERIPTTVADLLSLFGGPGGVGGSIPPALKRRATDLVTMIKGVVEAITSTSSPLEFAENRCEDTKSILTPVESSEAMSPIMPSLVVKRTNESRLWAANSSSTSVSTISISRSTLLGASNLEGPVEKTPLSLSTGREGTYSTTGSVLFGSASSRTAAAPSSGMAKFTFTHAQVSGDSAERFKILVQKIHKALVIAPVVSMPLSAPVKTSEPSLTDVPVDVGMERSDPTAPEASDRATDGPAGQIEIPFVPIHQRHTRSNAHDDTFKDDTIILVGQPNARQRKRKRDKSKGMGTTSQAKSGQVSASTGDHDRDVEGFDYSNVPNLLDNESKAAGARGVHEDNERSRKKQRHGKGSGPVEYGNFRAPPRDQREVRSGNKTHTFR